MNYLFFTFVVLQPIGVAEVTFRSGVVYHSSKWEQLWLDNIREWQNDNICEAIYNQSYFWKVFMNDTCTRRTHTAWCEIDDTVHTIFYNTITGDITQRPPKEWPRVERQAQEHSLREPSNTDVWSYFERFDHTTGISRRDYIEPLVSFLRHPLALCGPSKDRQLFGKRNKQIFLFDRSYVQPPPHNFLKGNKALYFDAGASTWGGGAGGPSLKYFADQWARRGIVWDHIEGWECNQPETEFYKTVPNEWKNKTTYHQRCVATTPDKEPFIPSVIRQKATKDDYVLFKLDIDSANVETKIVDHLLSTANVDIEFIDEFLWEQHVKERGYMQKHGWGRHLDYSKDIADSYQYFLRLRQRGVRAHSWV